MTFVKPDGELAIADFGELDYSQSVVASFYGPIRPDNARREAHHGHGNTPYESGGRREKKGPDIGNSKIC